MISGHHAGLGRDGGDADGLVADRLAALLRLRAELEEVERLLDDVEDGLQDRGDAEPRRGDDE